MSSAGSDLCDPPMLCEEDENNTYIYCHLLCQNEARKNRIEIEILLLNAKNWVFFCSDWEDDSSLVQYVIYAQVALVMWEL